MSTRSIIVVHGRDLHNDAVVRLYKHSDGYPTGALGVINEALEAAQKNKYTPIYGDDKKPRINVSTLVGLLIAAGTSEYGMGVQIDTDFDDEKLANFSGAEFNRKKHLGRQSDLEWVYIIDVNKQTVSIFGGGYTGKTPDTFKPADPYAYAGCLYEQYQAGEIDRTKKLINSIEAWSFKVICKEAKPKKRTKRALKAVSNE